MKKFFVILLTLPLLLVGKTYAQEKGQLIRYDLGTFEKTVKDTEEVKSTSFLLSWAKEVFRNYCDNKSVKVDFSEADYKNAKTELARLQKDTANLIKAKNKALDDLLNEKQKVSTANSEKEALQKEINNLQKQLSTKTELDNQIKEKDVAIANLNQQISTLNGQISSQQSRLTEGDAKLNQLVGDKAALNNEKLELQGQLATVENEKASLNSQLKDKETQIASLNNTVAGLQKSNLELTERIAQYTAAFDNTRNTINSIYDANRSKPIADMNPIQLDQARNTYEGMKPLLAIDPALSKELEGKINEMTAWKTLYEPLKGAKQYMKGKYNNDERQRLIAEINKINVAGEKATEKAYVLTLLEDQAKLKAKYDDIVRDLEIRGCLPTADQLKVANSNFTIFISHTKKYYHPSTYDSYDRAINTIKEELENPKPSDRVKKKAEFDKFIAELREMF